MASSATVGIVTVTYNSANVLAGFMASLLAQTWPDWKLYAIDNASSDQTPALLAQYVDARVSVTLNRENVGVAAGNNQGIRSALAAGCAYIWLINNDTEFGPELLQNLVRQSAAQPCDIVTPKIMYYAPPHRIWAAGGYFSRWRAYASLHYGQGEQDLGQYDTPRWIDFAPTCCLLINARVFDRIGLMDETYFVYFDDADFCFRAKRAGLRMLYWPQAVLSHKESSLTGGRKSEFALRFSARNKLYFLKKNLGPVWLGWAALYQIYLLLRIITGRDSIADFKLRQRSFLEGLKLKVSRGVF